MGGQIACQGGKELCISAMPIRHSTHARVLVQDGLLTKKAAPMGRPSHYLWREIDCPLTGAVGGSGSEQSPIFRAGTEDTHGPGRFFHPLYGQLATFCSPSTTSAPQRWGWAQRGVVVENRDEANRAAAG